MASHEEAAEATLSREDTIALILSRSRRPGRMPVRRTFVQQGQGSSRNPGPLAELVRRGDGRALDALLLLLALASSDPFAAELWSSNWGRALGIAKEAAARTAVSRVWRRLRLMRLVQTERGRQGKTRVTLLREDGSAERYARPNTTVGGRDDLFFLFPFDYWTDRRRFYETLSLPAKAVLLISLSMTTEEFYLPQERAGEWYGTSADTIGRGLRDLQSAGVLRQSRREFIPSLDSRTGYIVRLYYRLLPPFDLASRLIGRRRAAKRSDEPLQEELAAEAEAFLQSQLEREPRNPFAQEQVAAPYENTEEVPF